MLAAECVDLALRFARNPEDDRFQGLPYRALQGGAPELEVAAVFIDCVVTQSHLAGDHKIVVGRGLRVNHNSHAPPLLYHKGAYPRMA